MHPIFRLSPAVAALGVLMATPAWSNDARSIALGGSAIANGQGAHGAFENPASMMNMKRQGEKTHFRLGFSLDVRDTGDSIDTLTDEDNESLISDIETEIDTLSNQPIECNPLTGSENDICLSGTQSLSDLSERILDIIDIVDDESLAGQGTFDMGLAFTQMNYPMAIHLRVSATAAGSPEIAAGDSAYIQELETLLDGDSLTLGEVSNSTYLEANAFGIPLGVQQPEDVLQSSGDGSSLLRTQLGVSFASMYTLGEHQIDVGITPKFSSLTAYRAEVDVADEFQDDSTPIADRFDDSEVTESSFTMDLGASMTIKQLPIRVAATIRNLVPESIETADGFKFETTPQLILGAHYQRGLLSLTGDIALNEAKVDNLKTQKIAFGAEFGTRMFVVRGGISHNAARITDTTALSLGFGLGPLQVGSRITDFNSIEAGFQFSHSF